MNMQKFTEKIIETGLLNLRKLEYDYSVCNRKIGVPFSKKDYETVEANLNEINDFGKNKNIKISYMKREKYGNYIFFEFID